MTRTKARKAGNIKKRGAPTHDVNGIKTVNIDKVDELERLEDAYTKGLDEPAENVMVRHPNRNLDKPDIDKPPYS